jgi:hypothetical protein
VREACAKQIFPPVGEDSHSFQVNIFIWLLANNKILTREPGQKRVVVEDIRLACNEQESIKHFFYCCVAQFFKKKYEIIGLSVGNDFESVARFWLGGKKFKAVNVCTSVALWTFVLLHPRVIYNPLGW